MFETTTNSEILNDVHQPANSEERSVPVSTLKLPTKPSKTSISVERKEKQKLFEQHQGSEDAQKWLETAHPDEIIAFIRAVGERHSRIRNPWALLRTDFPQLHDDLESWGKEYSDAFISCVRTRWHVVKMPWEHVMYSEGIADGRKWANETTRPQLVESLRSAVTNRPLEVLPNKLNSYDQWEFVSPAHKLVVSVLGDEYPRSAPAERDDIGDIISDCDEFKEFWQPFVDEPMDKVVKTLLDVTSSTCKLQSPIYIAGFVDGALGLSDSLRLRHLPS
ncbi:hypothetical protein [Fimbriiglobus ruber]|uniref:hypothetical protein n=1 Tax=Fimbriiglobus ruber TaxID=1908690 RepID=UPI000B4A72CC|nr:hypothetical protein [Fimbriiglobus ruber]